MKFYRYIVCAFLFIGAAIAETMNINWINDGETYAQTTCEIGGDVILPTTPTKRGYTFAGWLTVYTRLEYIVSTGTQYIDTRYYANNNTEWTVKSKGAPFFGYINNASGSIACNYITSNNQWAWYSYRTYRYGFDNNSIYIITIKNKQLFINDELIDTQSASIPDVWQSPYTLALFGLRRTATEVTTSSQIIYRFTIKENNTLVRNFIPAKRNSDNVVGMYDTVSRQFFTNSGTGEFIAGPVAENQNFNE